MYALRLELIGLRTNIACGFRELDLCLSVDGRITSMVVFIDPASVFAVPSFRLGTQNESARLSRREPSYPTYYELGPI